MPEPEIDTSHLEPVRADAARSASERVLTAARAWANAPKQRVGAVNLPADLGAARAFDAFHNARRELAHHVGGETAARWAAQALARATKSEAAP